MALNAASHNPAGIKTGPVSGPPPPASADTTAALLGAAKDDPMGQHEGGKDFGDGNEETKIENQKKLENKRREAEEQKNFGKEKVKEGADSSASAAGSMSKTEGKDKSV